MEPMLRFKADDGANFPDWEEKTLGDEGKFYGGLSGKTKEDFETGDAHFVTYMNVYKNAFASQDMMGCVNVGAGERQNRVLYGDLLFTQSSETVEEVGLSSVYLHDDEPYLNSFCMGYRFNSLEDVSPEFIGYCMRSGGVRKSIMLMGQGISRINLGAKRLGTVSYRLPSLPEQRKIADLLSAVDDVIAAQKAEVAAWEKRKKGVMQKLFSQEVRFKADDGSDFPDWEERRIDDVCVLNPQTEALDDKFYYMDLGSIDHGRWEVPEIVSKADAPSRAQRVAEIDDVFFQSVRPYNMGHYHYVTAKDKQVVASTGYIQARMRHGSNAFLYQLFYEERFNAEVNARCTGSNYPAINSRKFGEIIVALPSLPEQRKIADCLSALDDVIIKAKNELAKWQELKKGLLQQMFV